MVAAALPPADHSIAYHETLKADPTRWAELELRGTSRVEADVYGPALVIEMRNCSCHSTLAVELA